MENTCCITHIYMISRAALLGVRCGDGKERTYAWAIGRCVVVSKLPGGGSFWERTRLLGSCGRGGEEWEGGAWAIGRCVGGAKLVEGLLGKSVFTELWKGWREGCVLGRSGGVLVF